LRKVFGNGKFDEYSILTKPGLPVDFLYDRKRTTRSAIHLGFTGLPIKELGCNGTRGVRIPMMSRGYSEIMSLAVPT
jgi:hypothetical protein